MNWVDEIGRLSVRNMRYFVAFVECGTISGATAVVGSSAAVLRSRLKSLSEAVGQPLFERSGSTFMLTEAGAGLFVACKEALSQLDSIHDDVKAAPAKGLVAGRVKLGIDPGIARVLMSSVILPLLEAHPKLDVIAHEAAGPTLHTWLEEGAIDLAIGMPTARHWWITELANYHERLVICSRNPLPDCINLSDPADGEEFSNRMFACYPLTFGRTAMFDLTSPPLQVKGFLTSMAFVNKGTWCTVVPLSAVLEAADVGTLHVRPIPSHAPERRLMVRHTDKPLNEAAALVVSAVSELFPSFDERAAALLKRI